MDIESCYRTKDIALGAFLYASGKKLIDLKNDNGRSWFVFEDRISCQNLADMFWRKEAMINAKDFADSMRTLKDLIFSRESK